MTCARDCCGVPVVVRGSSILCNTRQHITTHRNILQHSLVLEIGGVASLIYDTRQHTATHCNTLQHTADHCNTLHIATHCRPLQHTTYCNILQTTATHCGGASCRVSPGARPLNYRTQETTIHCNTLQLTHCNLL